MIEHLEKLHTTELGIMRVKRNISLEISDVVEWCKHKTLNADKIIKKGKNWYVHNADIKITINSHSYTIITAHKVKL